MLNNKEENLEWEEVKVEHLVKDEYIDFKKSDFKSPSGEIFGPYYTYSRKDYVVIVAVDEDGRYICVRQFRQGLKKVTTEFCAGGIERFDNKEYRDDGNLSDRDNTALSEPPLEAAIRELREETGYVSDDWKHLLTIPSNATVSDNFAHVFFAKNCKKVSDQELDDTEFLNVVLIEKNELEDMIKNLEFEQAVHVMAYLLSERA